MLSMNVWAADVTVVQKETLTVGRVGLEISFAFSSDWEGLQKIAVFEGAATADKVLVGDSTTVPTECLAEEGHVLRVGVYGASEDGRVVIPTLWGKFGKVQASAIPSGTDAAEPEPNVVAQLQTIAATAMETAQRVRNDADAGSFNGADGANGATFTPAVDAEGNLTWTNDGGRENPESVNLKGPRGEQGEQGAAGADGYTPVKGVDYLTNAEIEQIKEEIENDLSGGGSGETVTNVSLGFG